jgi:hypothetical protein
VFLNERTGCLSLASKYNDFDAPPVFHNCELTARCATIAYQVQQYPDASIRSQPVMTFGDGKNSPVHAWSVIRFYSCP